MAGRNRKIPQKNPSWSIKFGSRDLKLWDATQRYFVKRGTLITIIFLFLSILSQRISEKHISTFLCTVADVINQQKNKIIRIFNVDFFLNYGILFDLIYISGRSLTSKLSKISEYLIYKHLMLIIYFINSFSKVYRKNMQQMKINILKHLKSQQVSRIIH